MLTIYCEDFDFDNLAAAFEGEIISDCTLAAEVVFVDGEKIRELNSSTRGVDAVTDVLSYPSLDGIRGVALKKANFPADVDENGNLFIGSIAVCTQRAEEQAKEYGHSYGRELHYLVTHGIFHLLGYDHMTESDKAEMRLREERVLARINLKRDGE